MMTTLAPARTAGFSSVDYGAMIIARHGAAKGRKVAVPFGPFLALGGAVAWFAGDAMVDWYLDTFA